MSIAQRRRRNISLRSELLEARRVLDSTVVFNEIMYNPLGADDETMEYIELHNQLAVDMDISDWRLEGGVRYQFPDGTIVPGRSQLVVAVDPAALKEATGLENVLGPWEGRLNNDGEALQLFNNDERLMNAVTFNDAGDWPEGPDGGGMSLSKLDQQSASHMPENWTFSRKLGGTPGDNNFQPDRIVEQHDVLAEGAPASAIVPTDDSLGLSWVQPGFDDSTWLQGITGVGYDSSRRESLKEFLGLDLDAPPNDQAPMPARDVNPSIYVRIPFHLDRDPSEYERLLMLTRYDDGFVAYLNGEEWTFANAPGRGGEEGELSWNSESEGSNAGAATQLSFDVLSRADLLKPGDNILAVHLLNRRVSDSDMLFSPSILGVTERIPDNPLSPLKFNELGGSDSFFVEIVNPSLEEQSLDGLILTTDAEGATDYAFPAGTLGPGERVSVSADQLGFAATAGAQIQLYKADRQTIIDVREISDQLEGFHEVTGDWQYPTTTTPGQENSFATESDIVINEIMYHAPTTPGVFETPPEFQRTEFFPITSNWRYNQAGVDLGPDWFNTVHAVDNQQWFEGPGPLGAARNELNPPIQTPLTVPRDNDPRFLTHYFQTEFEVTAEMMEQADIFEMLFMIDDGAAFYVNGQEIRRFKLPSGELTFETRATQPAVATPALTGPVPIPKEVLNVGTNVLSIETRQDNDRSRDIAMGVSLSFGQEVTDRIPGIQSQANPEEWIELYNRGDQAVDLTGWELRDAVRFDFADQTSIGPGEYLVIANDAEVLAQKFPGITVAGSFDGRLGNRDDRIRLYDSISNLADDVHYYERGRWPATADGGGVSLELRDPDADNNIGESWSISDNSSQSEWVSHSRRGIADLDVTGSTAAFHEFVFGMLSASQVLIDDISVIQDPAGEAIQVIQNGTFEADPLGQAPEKWRIIGNHSGVVITDPTDPNNKVLHLTATGAQANIHDHAETTFANELEIVPGREYEISFRAKWLNGNSQLNSRLFYNRIPDTLNLHVPDQMGTPGAVNSSHIDNDGPTFDGLAQDSVIPKVNQPVTVSINAHDPDGVSQVTLWWRPDGGEWSQAPMSANALGAYEGQIPGHDSGQIVQFYAEATDSLGATSTFPAEGPESGALLQVADGKGPLTPIDTFRIIIRQDDLDRLYERTNRMSNWFLPITLVHNQTPYYDVSVRQIGSRWIRPNSGYKVRLHPDQAFNGVHDSLRFDLNGLAEIVMKQMMNRAGGGRTTMYDDISYLVVPEHRAQNGHNHEILLNLARFETIYLDEQFENGGQGTKWELDDVVFPSAPVGREPEGLKADTMVIETADIGVNSDITFLQGNDPEFYRAHVLIKNRRVDDRFDALKEFAHGIHTSGEALFEASNAVMDVDLWMRHYANQSYFGNWDTYGFRRPKNLRMYQRPSDGKIIPFFWDCDLCNFTEPIYHASEPTSRLDEIRDIPHNLRLYWGHMLDYVNRSFNAEYVAYWANHYGELTSFNVHGGDETFVGIVESTENRSERVLGEINEAIPPIDFAITTENGTNVESSVTLEGTGWVNVRKIQVAGTGVQLDAFWPTTSTWQIELDLLSPGENQITLEAIDYEGQLIGTSSVTINSTADNPVINSLRVSELNYNPGPATQAEQDAGYGNDDFEFVELVNRGPNEISLADVRLAKINVDGDEQGIEFAFGDSPVTTLAPGAHVIVVEDLDAFQARYGEVAGVAGQWSGRLSNTSETLTLTAGGSLVQQFAYQDEWYPLSDGDGSSLVIVNPDAELEMWSKAEGWSPSGIIGGSPGTATGRPGDANGDGVFDSQDLTLVLQSGKFEDDIPDNSTFAEGDWDGDGDFTTTDIVVAFMVGGYSGGPVGAVQRLQPHPLAIDHIFADTKERDRDSSSSKRGRQAELDLGALERAFV